MSSSLTSSELSQAATSASLERNCKLLFLGLDGAGKTSFIKCLQNQSIDEVQPTTGFAVAQTHYKGVHYGFWDIGGAQEIRELWQNYLPADILVWAIDITDMSRFSESRSEFEGILKSGKLVQTPCVILATKGSGLSSVVSETGIEALCPGPVKVGCTNATERQGMSEFWQALEEINTTIN